MNDLLSRDRLEALMNAQGEPLVSLYMPAHRRPNEAEQDPIRLKNLLTAAEEQLKTQGLRTTTIRKILQPAEELRENALFWRHQSDGLALFLSENQSHILRLPISFRELAVVGDFWHIKPLLPLFAGDGRFYILALSQNQVRMLEGTRHGVSEVALDQVPTSLAEALRFDDPERQLQFHTSTTNPGNGGMRAAIFHGHGVGEDDDHNDVLRFFQRLDDGLQPILRNQRAPLVLAGVERLLPIYRQASHYDYLLEAGITGNPQDLRDEQLHAAAWRLVEPHFDAQRRAAEERFHNAQNGPLAVINLRQAVEAAHQGRVDTIFVPLGERQWGTFDATTGRLELYGDQQPGARDLYDLAAVQTHLNGGAVFAVEPTAMPAQAPVAAILRY
jgi:hypothetical protein